MIAKDVMTTKVITVEEDTSVEEIARILIAHRISAVPVTDADGGLVGIVSEGDLMRGLESEPGGEASWWLTHLARGEDGARAYARTHGKLAKDVMTTDLVTADENETLASLARRLEANGIKRLPVLRHGELVGIVSRANLLQAVASIESAPESAAPSSDTTSVTAPQTVAAGDRAIRASILNTLHNELRVHGPINVIVSRGVVDLWGGVETEAQRQAVRAAAEAPASVTAVNDHLSVLPAALQPLLHSDT